VKAGEVLRSLDIDPAHEERILALDAERITEENVREILSGVPAPHIMNIHGAFILSTSPWSPSLVFSSGWIPSGGDKESQ